MKTGFLRKLLWMLMILALLCGAQAMAEEVYQDHAELLRDGYLPAKQVRDTLVLRGETFEDRMLAKIEARETEIDIEDFQLTPTELQQAVSDFLDVNPHLFFVSGGYSYSPNAEGYVSTIYITYLYSETEIAQKSEAFNASVNQIVRYASRADTALGKIMLVHDYLCANYEYDTTYSIYSGEEMFRLGTGVCQAYYECFQAVMNKLGIESKPATSESMNHVWNVVKLNGSWYHIDVTWGDPISDMPLRTRHQYFMLSDAGMEANGHYDWTSVVTADSTTYDSFFWSNVNTSIPVVGSTMYYVDTETAASERTVKAFDLTTGTASDVHTYSIAAPDGSYFNYTGYNPIAVSSNYLYYATLDSVYAVPLEGGTPVLMQTFPNADYVWTSWFDGSNVQVYVTDESTGEGTVFSLESMETAESVFTYTDNGDGTCTITGYTGIDPNPVIPDSVNGLTVTKIGQKAFNSSFISSITLPETLTTIELEAFAYCTNLTEITLPAAVTTVEMYLEGPFTGCTALENIYVAEGNTAYASVDGVLFNKNLTTLITFPAGRGGSYTVPATVQLVHYNAFAINDNLTELILQEGVTMVDVGAFRDGANLTSVVFPANDMTIFSGNFANCPKLVATVHKNSAAHSWCAANSIPYQFVGECPFEYTDNGDGTCTITGYTGTETDVVMPTAAGGLKITTIGQQAFHSSAITSIILPETLTTIESEAFAYCTNLTEFTIPAAVTSVESSLEGQFTGCTALQNIHVAEENTAYASVDGILFNKELTELLTFPAGRGGSYTVPASVETIYFNAFAVNDNVTELIIQEGVTIVDKGAFQSGANLTSVVFPANSMTIGPNNFVNCPQLVATVYENSDAHTWCVENSIAVQLVAESYPEYEYTANGDGTCTITDYTGTDSEIVIPATINGLQVTGIDDAAFAAHAPDGVMIENNYQYTSVVIPEGVTWIGDDAFALSSALTQVTFPETLVSIGFTAFEGCDIQTLDLPDGITTISGWAFSANYNLTAVDLPASLTELGELAFCSCWALNELTIEDTNTAYKTENNVLYTKDGTKLVLCPAGYEGAVEVPEGVTEIEMQAFSAAIGVTEVNLPSTLRIIGASAFNATKGLKSITLPEGLESIGTSAFNGSSIESIRIPEGITEIPNNAFLSCAALKTVELPSTITRIGKWAFVYCDALESLTLPDHIAELGESAFGWNPTPVCTLYVNAGTTTEETLAAAGWPYEIPVSDYSYTDNSDGTCTITAYNGAAGAVTIPETVDGLTVTGIASGAFAYCEDVTSIHLPATVSSIASDAFMPYCGVTAFTVDENNASFSAADGVLYNKAVSAIVCYPCRKTDTEYTAPDTVTAIGEYAFCQNYDLQSVVLPEGVTTIGTSAFEECSALTAINLPESIAAIGDNAFAGCGSLTATVMQNSYAEGWCIDNNVDYKLQGGTSADGLYSYTLRYDGTANITAYHGNADHVDVPSEINGVKVTMLGVGSFSGSSMSSITLPEGIQVIARESFAYCENLTAIHLPSTVLGVADSAFAPYCGAAAITVAEGNINLCSVDGVLFTADMTVLKRYPSGKTDSSYTVPAEVNEIYDEAFLQNHYLEQVVLSEGVTHINHGSFDSCTALAEVVLPESLVYIGNDAFANCASQLTFYVTENSWAHTWCVENGAAYVLGNIPGDYSYTDNGDGTCTILAYTGSDAEVVIPSEIDGLKVTKIGDIWTTNNGVFYANQNLTSVVIPDGVTEIDNWAFGECSNLTSVTLPEGLLRIGAYAFAWCDLETIDLPDSVTTIETDAFHWNVRMTSLDLPAALTSLSGRAFSDTGLTTVTLESSNTTYQVKDNVVYIIDGTELVMFPSGITGSFSIPEGVTTVSEGAFLCSDLNEIVFSSSVRNIAGAFTSMFSLTSVELNDGLEEIGERAFSSCSSLAEVQVPDSVTVIGDRAFWGCPELKITLPNNITSIGAGAFDSYGDNLPTIYAYAGTATADALTAAGYAYEEILSYTYTDNGDGTCTITRYTGSDTAVVIPDAIDGLTVTAIGDSAFEGFNFESLELPSTLTSLGSYAFFFHTNLTEVHLPANLTEIGVNPFGGTGVEKITIDEANTAFKTDGKAVYTMDGTVFKFYAAAAEGAYAVAEGTITIEEQAFSAAAGLTEISMPDSLENIGAYAFSEAFGLQKAALNDGLKTIGAYAFLNCTSLERLDLPDEITEIGSRAFETGLTSAIPLYVNAGTTTEQTLIEGGWTYETYSPFAYTDNGDGTCTIIDYTGTDSEIEIPAQIDGLQVTAIGEEAFAMGAADGWIDSNSQITSVVIPEGVTWIGENAFALSSALTQVTFPETLVGIGLSAFEGCDIQTLDLPDGITTISGWAFSANGNLTAVDLPANLTELGELAFASCWSMNQLTIEETNTVYKTESGVLYTKDGTKLVLCPAGYEGAVEVPEGVTEIETQAFSAAIGVTEVKLPSTLRTIGGSAFKATKGLKSITLPEGLESIGTAAFNGSNIESIRIPEGITEIPNNAFLSCAALKTVELPSTITRIGRWAFVECNALESLMLPDHIAELGSSAFGYGTTPVCTLYVNAGTTTEQTLIAGDWAYEIYSPYEYTDNGDGTCTITGYTGTDTIVEIPAEIDGYQVTAIGNNAFFGNETMTHVTIAEGIQSIGDSAFFHSQIESVSVPESVTSIGSRAFFASRLAEITIAETNPVYQSVDGMVFDKAGTTLLIYPIGKTQETYTVPDEVVTIGDFAFDGANLKTLHFNCTSQLEEIGEYALAYMDIESIILPPELHTIKAFAFYNNQMMTSVYFLGDAPTIDASSSFGSCGSGALTLYYCEGTEGWQSAWNGYSTAVVDSIEALHTKIVIEEAIAPTCTETGLTEGRSCAVCGEIFAVQETIAALGHQAEKTTDTCPATSEQDGVKAGLFCSVCDTVLREELEIKLEKTLFMPSALKDVQDEAFMGSAMQQITLPEGTLTIGSKAFAECPELILAVVPDSVESIADDAFEGSDQVLILTSEDSYAAQWAAEHGIEAESLK